MCAVIEVYGYMLGFHPFLRRETTYLTSVCLYGCSSSLILVLIVKAKNLLLAVDFSLKYLAEMFLLRFLLAKRVHLKF